MVCSSQSLQRAAKLILVDREIIFHEEILRAAHIHNVFCSKKGSDFFKKRCKGKHGNRIMPFWLLHPLLSTCVKQKSSGVEDQAVPPIKEEEGQHSMDPLKKKLSGAKADGKASTTSCSLEDRIEHYALSHTKCESFSWISPWGNRWKDRFLSSLLPLSCIWCNHSLFFCITRAVKEHEKQDVPFFYKAEAKNLNMKWK